MTTLSKTFVTAVNAARASGEKLADKIHALCMESLSEHLLHGNQDKADYLVANLPKGIKKQAVLYWFAKFGAFSAKDDALVYSKGKRKGMVLEAQIKAAEAMPFWLIESEKKAEKMLELDFEATIAAFIKREALKIGKARQQGLDTGDYEAHVMDLADKFGFEFKIVMPANDDQVEAVA